MSSRRARLSKLVLLTALALGSALLGASGAEAKHARAKPPAAETVDCKKDADCVAVVDDCCPCTQGGKLRAVPKKDQATHDKDLHKRCEGTACIDVMSQDATCSQQAFCAAGICELRDAPTAAP